MRRAIILNQLTTVIVTCNKSAIQMFTGRGHNVGINELLCDHTMGGSNEEVSGHGLVLAMHLHRQFNSAPELIQILSDDSSTLVKDVHCMKPLQRLSSVSNNYDYFGFHYHNLNNVHIKLMLFKNNIADEANRQCSSDVSIHCKRARQN